MPSPRCHLNLSPWALLLCLGASGWAQAPTAQPSAPIQPAAVAPVDNEALPRLPPLLWTDTKVVFRTPAAWDASDWHRFWLAAAGVIVAGVALDGPVDRAFKRSARPSWDRTAKNVALLGGAGSVLIAGGTYLGGAAFDNRELRSVGIDLGMAMAIAELGLALPIKALAGRSRPLKEKGTSHFRPLQSSQSFPSSHTVQAFVLASVISDHANQPWVTGVSYGLASLVGVARLEQRQHFVSDVLGGALIGTFVGRTVTRYNQTQRAGTSSVKLTFQPLLSSEYKGAVVRVNF